MTAWLRPLESRTRRNDDIKRAPNWLERFVVRSSTHRLRIGALELVVFVLDTATGIDIVIPVLYVNVVLLAMRSGRRSDVSFAGWGSIVLTILSFLLTIRPSVPLATPFFNTALSILAILCVTLLSLKNISSQTEILRARERIALVSRSIFLKSLSTSVVHEVTQPITSIGANAEAARRWLDKSPPNLDETATALRRIAEEVKRISALVGRLRGSIVPGEDTVRERCDVLLMVERAVEHLKFEIGGAEVHVNLVCTPDLAIAADRVMIEQVLVNALSNAVDALCAGGAAGRQITISTRALPERIQISIEDNGVGVNPAALEQIFDTFYTTKGNSGIGIGLAFSKSIVEAHGGTIRAVPNTPRGLIVEITFPLSDAELQ